jgi:hypothetical protein
MRISRSATRIYNIHNWEKFETGILVDKFNIK